MSVTKHRVHKAKVVAGTDKLNNLRSTKDVVQHKDVIPIIQAVSQGHSFSEIEKVIKSLKRRTRDRVFWCIIRALTYTMVKLNRTDLIQWVLGEYLLAIKDQLHELLVFACMHRHYDITAILLKAGTDPNKLANESNMLNSAPHEDLGKTVESFNALFPRYSKFDLRAWRITLCMDDVALFKQMYSHDTCTLLQGGTSSFILVRGITTIVDYKMCALSFVCRYEAHSILGFCLANQIYHVCHNNPGKLRNIFLSLLFKCSCKCVDILQKLFQHGILKADHECLFPIQTEEGDTFFPANPLHHVVSLGMCGLLHESCILQINYAPLSDLRPHLHDIVNVLLSYGARADGLVKTEIDNQIVYIRPVTFLAIHSCVWMLKQFFSYTYCFDECMASIQQILDALPCGPQDMRPFEMNPLVFTLLHTVRIADALACRNSLLCYREYSEDQLTARWNDALRIAEFLYHYFLNQGFRLHSNYGNIYTLMHDMLKPLGHEIQAMEGQSPEYSLHQIMDATESFALRMAKVLLAYHSTTDTYTKLYSLLLSPCILDFDRKRLLLKSLLNSSGDQQYYQILRGFMELVKENILADKESLLERDLQEFCQKCLSNRPRPLKQMCRVVIFHTLNAPVYQHAEDLPLPKQLVSYIVELS